MKEITIYCDGSAIGNPGPGGWGATILVFQNRGGRTVKEIGGGEKHTTNNRMELMAAIESLKKIPAHSVVTIKTDSQYAVKGITGWVYGWEKNGWKTTQKQDVLNKDLWKILMKAVSGSDVTFEHVRGHSGNLMNERVDQIANALARGEKIYPVRGGAHTTLSNGVKLYEGDERGYKEFLANLPKARAVSGKSGKAYSYISLVDGRIMTHKTWAECEKRVAGQKAKFKKVFSAEEETELIESWQK